MRPAAEFAPRGVAKNKVGPTLYGVYGSVSGKVEGFKYSKAMASSDIIWDEEALNGFFGKS